MGRKAMFCVMFAVTYVATIVFFSGGVLNAAALYTAPIILCAQAIVFGMVYLSTYHGENEEGHAPLSDHAFQGFKNSSKESHALQH